MYKVLIIDDNRDISELLSLILEEEGIKTEIINNSLDALKLLEKGVGDYNLILLDIMMPKMSGTELCLKIRDKVDIPIIFISAKKDIVDKMLGYEIGGDDYITKPFENVDLILKVKSHLRMSERINKKSKQSVITIGEITLNEENYEVTKNGKKISLSSREFELLSYLMRNAGLVLSKEKIFEDVWGYEFGEISTVAVNIKSLRDKIDVDNKYIITVWGYGYKFVRDLENE